MAETFIPWTFEEHREREAEPVLDGFESVADATDEAVAPIFRYLTAERRRNSP